MSYHPQVFLSTLCFPRLLTSPNLAFKSPVYHLSFSLNQLESPCHPVYPSREIFLGISLDSLCFTSLPLALPTHHHLRKIQSLGPRSSRPALLPFSLCGPRAGNRLPPRERSAVIFVTPRLLSRPFPNSEGHHYSDIGLSSSHPAQTNISISP